MIVIETFLFFIVIVAALSLTQVITYLIYRKTKRKALSLLATVGLLLLGTGAMAYIGFSQVAAVDSWIALALIILGIVLAITLIISLGLSFLLFYLFDHGFLTTNQKQKHP